MRRPRLGLLMACLTGLMASVSACQSVTKLSAAPASTDRTTASPSTSVTTAIPTPSASPTTKRVPRPRATVAPARTTTPPRPATLPPICHVPSGVTSRQVILVDAHGSGATIRACKRSGSRYRLALGPYSGHVGINGVSSTKREGDLHTPAGVFPMRNGFGVNGNPGLGAGSWLRVDARDVWVDDPRSSLYNTHQRSPADGRWLSAERLLLSPAYNYAQVIGYNEGRTPGRGSAIFMHVDRGRGTAGCVSLSTSGLLSVMRWERPGVVMAITP
jgi:L,D-peptidoglycan transpeptidase YkuD (ErfK/YbiS/YcfS/YnhG family)